MDKDLKIYIAGHNGMVGSAIKRKLEEMGYKNLIFRNSFELNLEDQKRVEEFFQEEKPEYVFDAAAKVGGIHSNNTYRAEFIYKNLQIQNHLIHFSWKFGVKKLLFLASNCVYPKNCLQPIKESYLLSGYLEPTNQPFSVAKIAGIEMCQSYNKQYGTNFISVVAANSYGINDTYDLSNSHLIPSLILKFHEAKINNKNEVDVWGTGKPRREGMYVDDLADACIFLMQKYDSSEIINVGTGIDRTIKEIANLVKDVVEFDGKIVFDETKPDGMSRKILDVSKINNLGWKAKIDLKEGIKLAYGWFVNTRNKEK
ncbi:MAG: GDP-L-fucose synthase [Nanoarchaeota archaeon]|nr:GDP-L-fucose synthase [Nanoarchaeota archaeon]